eukprot:scaffold15108_cov180-Amphora_coffeaeformis.AAC.40
MASPFFSLQIHSADDAESPVDFWDHLTPNSAGGLLVTACTTAFGWDRDLAGQVLQAYRQFVLLKIRLQDWDGTQLPPPPLVAQMWDWHKQQDVTAYAHFCFHQNHKHRVLMGGSAWQPDHLTQERIRRDLQLLFENDEVNEGIWKFTSSSFNASSIGVATLSRGHGNNAHLISPYTQSTTTTTRSTVSDPKPAVVKKHHQSVKYESPGRKKAKKESNALARTAYRVSEALSAVAGGRRYLTRSDVPTILWDYIKQHRLQDPRDGRMIHCDKKFQAIMDNQFRMTFCTMTKIVQRHILDQADFQLYVDEQILFPKIEMKKR